MLKTIPPSLWEEFNRAQLTTQAEAAQKLIVLMMQAQTEALERIADCLDQRYQAHNDEKKPEPVILVSDPKPEIKVDEDLGDNADLENVTD